MASLAEKQGTLGLRLAAHLLRRSTFYLTVERIQLFANKTATEAVDTLLNQFPAPILDEPVHPETGQVWLSTHDRTNDGGETGNRRDYIRNWWLHEALHDPSIQHKMIFFHHANFVISEDSRRDEQFFDHLSLLKFYALGNFKALAKKMTLDNVMLYYLDNRLNREGNPNENYAREFLELFTIGKGPQLGPGDYTHYTEYDIAEAARVLTGFRDSPREERANTAYHDPDTGIFRGRADYNRHDPTDKTFSHAFNEQLIAGAVDENDMWRELDDFVEMVFAQPATARHICRKVYRFFVSNKIDAEIEADIIDPLAQLFMDNDYDIKPVVERLLKSEHFYDEDDADSSDEVIGALIKSPLELGMHALSLFELQPPDPITDADRHHNTFYENWFRETFMEQAGLDIFAPPDVAGYPAYYQEPEFKRQWFNTSTIITRYKLGEMLLTGERVLQNGSLGGVQLDIAPWIKSRISDPRDAELLVRELLGYMIPEQPDPERFGYFLSILLDDLSPINWRFEWLNYETTLDDSSVKIPLNALITAIMYSPEYQMF